jgi:hypothetical protein
MIKIKYVGGYEDQIAFTCSGVAPVILNIGDMVEIPQEVYDSDFKDDPRFEVIGSVKAETEKSSPKIKGKVK